MATFEDMLKEGSKLSDTELTLINEKVLEIFGNEDHRPVVVLALAAHLIGCTIRASEGKIDRDGAMKWVDILIQI